MKHRRLDERMVPARDIKEEGRAGGIYRERGREGERNKGRKGEREGEREGGRNNVRKGEREGEGEKERETTEAENRSKEMDND